MRKTLILGALLVTAAVSAVAEEKVNYASYGGAYQEGVRKAILDHLPQDHGMTVVDYVLAGGIRDIRTKVRANAVDIDVAELYGGLCDLAGKEELLVPLDYSRIPNAAGIPEHLRSKYWVGFTAYTSVLAYNKNVYGEQDRKTGVTFSTPKSFPVVVLSQVTRQQRIWKLLLWLMAWPRIRFIRLIWKGRWPSGLH